MEFTSLNEDVAVADVAMKNIALLKGPAVCYILKLISMRGMENGLMEKNRTFEDVIHAFDEVYQTGTCVKRVPPCMQQHDGSGLDTRSGANK